MIRIKHTCPQCGAQRFASIYDVSPCHFCGQSRLWDVEPVEYPDAAIRFEDLEWVASDGRPPRIVRRGISALGCVMFWIEHEGGPEATYRLIYKSRVLVGAYVDHGAGMIPVSTAALPGSLMDIGETMAGARA